MKAVSEIKIYQDVRWEIETSLKKAVDFNGALWTSI